MDEYVPHAVGAAQHQNGGALQKKFPAKRRKVPPFIKPFRRLCSGVDKLVPASAGVEVLNRAALRLQGR